MLDEARSIGAGMTQFQFVLVLLSMIVGLGIAELLTNFARQIRTRTTTRTYWLHSLFVLFVFIALLQQWWEIWSLQSVPQWSFPVMLLMLGGPICVFIIAHLTYPETVEGKDLKAYYYENARLIFTIGIIATIISTSFRPLSFGVPIMDPDNLMSLVGIGILAILAISRNEWVHRIFIPVILISLLIDIVVFNNEI
jgi:hypothetical protein